MSKEGRTDAPTTGSSTDAPDTADASTVATAPDAPAAQRQYRFEIVHPSTLTVNPRNPRTISARGLAKIQRSIERFGFASPVLARADNNEIIAGHQRLKAAIDAGVEEIPVLFLDLDAEEALLYNLADNRLAEEADWDDDLLAGILAELKLQDEGLPRIVGFEDEEVEKVLARAAGDHAADFLRGIADEASGSNGPGSSADFVQLSYALTPEQREIVLHALNMARKQFGLDTSADALVKIAQEFNRQYAE